MFNEKDQLAIDTIRALSIDAIEKQIWTPWFTNGSCPMAYTLWTRHLNFNPNLKIILIEIDSFFQQDMALLYYIVYYMYQVV